MNSENERVEAIRSDEQPFAPVQGGSTTRDPQMYRDNYEGRGKYAKENHAMLDREQARLDAWHDESTLYKSTNMRLFFVVAAVLLAATILAAVYYLAFGIQRGLY
jgi:hypothetical protein